jgi:lipopolysaccharide/colanic/teichoic acid biosynthesis glycosyltransferase
MVMNGDQVLLQYLAQHPELALEWERNQKLKDDPRVTRIGKFLRRTSLDELPQLWNVLKGEMSLVGPRPIIQEEVARYGDRFSLYTQVYPGLTGLWQVSGRNDTSYDERVRLDTYYVRNWSLWLDIYLLARTAGVVLAGRGAY